MSIFLLLPLIGLWILCSINDLRSCSFLSCSGVTFFISANSSFTILKSACKSIFQPAVFISARFILILSPMLNSSSNQSSLSVSKSTSSIRVSSAQSVLPLRSNSSILSKLIVIPLINLPSVILKESTELSSLFSKLTLMRVCRLFSRWDCLKRPPLLMLVSYRSL